MEEKVPLTSAMCSLQGIGLIPFLLTEKSELSKEQSFTKIMTSSGIQTYISWGYNLICPWLCMDLEIPMLLCRSLSNGSMDGMMVPSPCQLGLQTE